MLSADQKIAVLSNKIDEVAHESSSFVGDGLRIGQLRAEIEMNLFRPDALANQGQTSTDTALASSKLESKD